MDEKGEALSPEEYYQTAVNQIKKVRVNISFIILISFIMLLAGSLTGFVYSKNLIEKRVEDSIILGNFLYKSYENGKFVETKAVYSIRRTFINNDGVLMLPSSHEESKYNIHDGFKDSSIKNPK
jgi:hypothetical protein